MVKHFYLTYLWIPTNISTLGKNGPGSNGNDAVLHIHPSFRTGALSWDRLESYLGNPLGCLICVQRCCCHVIYSLSRLNYGNLISLKKIKWLFFQAVVRSVRLHGGTIWSLSKSMKKKLDFETKFWKQHPTKQLVYSHLHSISRTNET